MPKLINEETNFIRCMEIIDFTDAYYDCKGFEKCLVHGAAIFQNKKSNYLWINSNTQNRLIKFTSNNGYWISLQPYCSMKYSTWDMGIFTWDWGFWPQPLTDNVADPLFYSNNCSFSLLKYDMQEIMMFSIFSLRGVRDKIVRDTAPIYNCFSKKWP